MNNREAKKILVQYCKRLDTVDMVTLYEGNVSMRTDEGFIITPSAFDKAYITEDDVIEFDADGNVLNPECGHKISTEYKLHLSAYEIRPDMNACIHFHSTYATAFAVAGKELNIDANHTALVIFGKIPLCKYGRAGTMDITDDLKKYLPDCVGLLLENHGAMVVSQDMGTAFAKAMILEKTAKIAYLTEQMGGDKKLPEDEIVFLRDVKGKKLRG